MAALAVLVGAPACDDKNPVAPDGAVRPTEATVQSITINGDATLRRPGDVVQLTATATFSDGTTRDVSAEASWSVDHSEIVTASRGLLTARRYGQCSLYVFYRSASAKIPVSVWPEGMFKLSGRITAEGGQPLWPVRVSVTPSGGEVDVLTDREGRYILPARGNVDVRAEFEGFEPQVKRLTVGADTTLDFRLGYARPGGFAGMYTLTYVASASCALPPEAMRRTYIVRVAEPSPGMLSVEVVSPEMVAWGGAGFSGRREGSRVQFVITEDFFSDLVFVELLDPGRELALLGNAAGEVGETVIATFNGSVTVRQRQGGTTIAQCIAEDHRLEFTR